MGFFLTFYVLGPLQHVAVAARPPHVEYDDEAEKVYHGTLAV